LGTYLLRPELRGLGELGAGFVLARGRDGARTTGGGAAAIGAAVAPAGNPDAAPLVPAPLVPAPLGAGVVAVAGGTASDGEALVLAATAGAVSGVAFAGSGGGAATRGGAGTAATSLRSACAAGVDAGLMGCCELTTSVARNGASEERNTLAKTTQLSDTVQPMKNQVIAGHCFFAAAGRANPEETAAPEDTCGALEGAWVTLGNMAAEETCGADDAATLRNSTRLTV
jgi:hypothetical protein